jgi:hypothetical protein
MSQLNSRLVLPAFTLLCSTLAFADADLLKPYEGAPPVVTISAEQEAKLAKGKAIYPPPAEAGEAGGGAMAIFRVNAPANTVWDVIANFDQYKGWVDGVVDIKRYKPNSGDNIFIQFTVGKWFSPNYIYHVIHNYPMSKTGWGTWTLDTSVKNDFQSCRGFWRVMPVKDNPNQSDVIYSVDLRASGPIMKLFKPLLLKSGVRDASSWVKKQAEIKLAEDQKAIQEKTKEAQKDAPKEVASVAEKIEKKTP